MALIFTQPKERRSNRCKEPDKYVIPYAILHKTFVEIMNITKAEMNDAEFRVHVQDRAHGAINYVEKKCTAI